MHRFLMTALILSSVSMQTVLAESVWVRCSLNTKTKVRFWGNGEQTISLGTSIAFKSFPDTQLDHGVDIQREAQPGE